MENKNDDKNFIMDVYLQKFIQDFYCMLALSFLNNKFYKQSLDVFDYDNWSKIFNTNGYKVDFEDFNISVLKIIERIESTDKNKSENLSLSWRGMTKKTLRDKGNTDIEIKLKELYLDIHHISEKLFLKAQMYNF